MANLVRANKPTFKPFLLQIVYLHSCCLASGIQMFLVKKFRTKIGLQFERRDDLCSSKLKTLSIEVVLAL